MKYWEQAILDRIIAGEPLSEEVYPEIYRYFLEDSLLKKKEDEERPQLRFQDDTSIPDDPTFQPVRLSKISNLQNVNALAPDQTLTFGPQLTAIYGANASGKSGYSRVFGCAGFTRGDRKIFPNVNDESGASGAQSADIEICSEDGNQNVCYVVGDQAKDLSFCHVFDSTSVNVHLTKSNEFSFSPAGLENLTRLAEETDVVRSMLRRDIGRFKTPHKFNEYFIGEVSPIAEIIRDLDSKTDIKTLEKLATITDEDEKKTKQCEERLNYLKNLKIGEKVSFLNKQGTDLQTLKTKLEGIKESLNDEVFRQLNDTITSFLKVSDLAKRMGVEQFKADHFTQTGSDTWYNFIQAAKGLAIAETETTGRDVYPQKGNRCLFCYQPLSDEALDLIKRLWKFLEDDIMDQLKGAESKLLGYKDSFQKISTEFFDEQSIYYRLIQELNPALSPIIQGFLEGCRGRITNGIKFITNLRADFLPSFPLDGTDEIQKLIFALGQQSVDLRKKNPAEEIEGLEKFLMYQRHRKIIQRIFPEVKVYVNNRFWAALSSERIGTTAHITRKYNEMFEIIAKKGYIERFNRILEIIGQSINVNIATSARKGITHKQIVLDKCATNFTDATPDKILSEGEKRAVALADFLAEVQVDPGCTSMVLDDPVTSFDLEWRGKIAGILAEEAKNRQVIIFTHDLAFLYYLMEVTEKQGVDMLCHWIQRSRTNGMPGYVSLDNSPAIDKSFKTPAKAQNLFERAKDEQALSEQERLLKDGFGALRTCYEAFIIFELLNGVVERFNERISFGRLEQIVWDETVVQEVIKKYEELSRLMEGHLHSTEFGYKEITPEILNSEIQHFAGLKKQLKELKKQKAAA